MSRQIPAAPVSSYRPRRFPLLGRLGYTLGGLILGLLLACGGDITTTVPQYKFVKKTVTARIPVLKEVPVPVNVYPKNYRIQMVKDGIVIKEWKMSKCRLDAVNLTLIDENGVEQQLTGDIRVVRE